MEAIPKILITVKNGHVVSAKTNFFNGRVIVDYRGVDDTIDLNEMEELEVINVCRDNIYEDPKELNAEFIAILKSVNF